MPRPEPTVRVIELRLSGRVVAAAAAAVEYCAGQHEDALAGAGPLVGWAVEALGALFYYGYVRRQDRHGYGVRCEVANAAAAAAAAAVLVWLRTGKSAQTLAADAAVYYNG